MRHKTKGIVVRETPKGETSKLLTVLTPDLGIITVNAKGVRKITSPYLKSAQLFAFSDLLLYEKNGFYTLTEAALITDFYSLRENIKNYSLACYFCEAAASFAVPGEESASILRLLLNSLYAVENDKSPCPLVKSAFELRLCSECGFMPETDICAECGDETTGSAFLFNISQGIALCRNCAIQNEDYICVTPPVGHAIGHIVSSELSRFISFRIGGDDQLLLSRISERFLLIRAERGFKTLSFYKHCEELP